MNRAVFLDRDNTIIHNDGDLADPDLVRLIQGSAIGIASMRGLGYRIVVVSNQPGVARGKFTEAEVDATNERIAEMTEKQANNAVIDRFYYCPFDPEGSVARYARDHDWRKPSPGMLLQAAKDMNLDLAGCWMVGDRLSDIAAGVAAGCRTILLADPKDPPTGEVTPDHIGRNLVEAARLIAQARPDPVPEHRRPEPVARSESPTDRREEREASADRERQREADRERTARHAAHGQDQDTDAPSTTATGTTYPATHPLESKHRPQQTARQSQRPFKPWAIQHADPDARAQPPRTAPAAEKPDAAADRAVAEARPSPGPVADVEADPPDSPDQAVAASSATPATPGRTASTDTRTEERTAPADTEPTHPGDVPGLLRQILREVKQQRVLYGDWSAYNILGLAVLQPLAALAALIGVFQENPAMTLLWLVGAGFLQLTVITTLLLHGQR